MAGFNKRYNVSNNYTAACKNKNKIRVYTYKDGTYCFLNGVKTAINEGDIINNKVVVNEGEYHHSKDRYGYNEVMFWSLKEKEIGDK